jgi:signal transduction histidine kinase
MIRLLPRSLFGQTVLILLVGLVVSHLVGAWIYAGDREQAVRAVGGLAAAQRVANLTRLVEETPVDERARVVAALSDPTFKVSLSTRAPGLPLDAEDDTVSRAIAEFVARQLPGGSARRLKVVVSGTAALPAAPPFGHRMPMLGPMVHAGGAWRGLQVAVELGNGQWLSFATTLPDTGLAVSWNFFLAMAVMAVIVLAISAWAVRRVTAPLSLLAGAAERLGKDVGTDPLPELGTTEMRRASRAFNQMQERLRRFVENRTRMLAAISHDLRTPLTLLRLRAEGVESTEERDRMLATIAEMDAMIGATLAYARDEAETEPRRRNDVAALLASIVDDMADAGLPVAMEPSPPVILECRPAALKRALANLLDNAVKYGTRARAAVRMMGNEVEIAIDDDGPGIPEPELAKVTQPFYRLDESRSRDTGGIGLGLAIAMSIIQAHGGELTLSNRTQGGLRARVVLPL